MYATIRLLPEVNASLTVLIFIRCENLFIRRKLVNSKVLPCQKMCHKNEDLLSPRFYYTFFDSLKAFEFKYLYLIKGIRKEIRLRD